jgi:hypothetical protein
MKLSQHGGFNEELLKLAKDALTQEFTEGEYDSFEFAQLCQRGDSSVYGIAGGKKCRKGSPISVKPGEGMPDIARKARERGLKQRDVKSIADAVREKYGAKVVKKGAPLESAARRLGERLEPNAQVKPNFLGVPTKALQSVLGHPRLNPAQREWVEKELAARGAKERSLKDLDTRSLEKEQLMAGSRGLRARQEMVRRVLGEGPQPLGAPAPKPKGEGTLAVEAKIQDMQKGLARVRKLKDEAGDPNAAKVYGSVEKAMQQEIKKMAQAGEATKLKAAVANKAYEDLKAAQAAEAAAPKKKMVVNKKLLQGARTGELMRVLNEESLNNYQRKRIEDELRGRGMSSSAIPKPAGKAARPAQRGEKAGFETPQGIKGYDPKKDIAGSGKLIGQGAMGRVKLTDGPPPGVTKEGKIGEFEAAALKRLEDTGITPRLHGVVVEGQAKRVSGGLGGHVKEASGYLGMSRVAGKPYGDQRWKMTQEQKEKAVDEYLRVRKEIHTRGVAHNDMHGGNFFYNAQTGKGGLVDFGLAQVSPKAALVEALGTTNGRDWQANRMDVGGYNTPAVKRFVSNAAKVRDRMRREHRVQINMDIRSPMDQINTAFGKMTDKDAETYLTQLYEGI